MTVSIYNLFILLCVQATLAANLFKYYSFISNQIKVVQCAHIWSRSILIKIVYVAYMRPRFTVNLDHLNKEISDFFKMSRKYKWNVKNFILKNYQLIFYFKILKFTFMHTYIYILTNLYWFYKNIPLIKIYHQKLHLYYKNIAYFFNRCLIPRVITF